MSTLDDEICKELRKDIFLAGYKGGMAHLASSFSSVEIIYTLYMKGIMKSQICSGASIADSRDRFVLSKGHASLALYSVLAKTGAVSENILDAYLQPDKGIGGEPNLGDVDGIEASTGSLGHGLSLAVGMALAQKYDGNGEKTFVLIGDGESQEGTIWEAAMSASAFMLDNLIVILDNNNMQKNSCVDEIMGYVEWPKKWHAFGWNVLSADGHDVDSLMGAFLSIPQNGKPTIIIAKTIKGKGVSIMENNTKWHFKLPNKKELKCFMDELRIREEELG